MRQFTGEWFVVGIIAVIIGALVMLFSGRSASAQSTPYQVYKISYGCLYVVTNGVSGGAAAVVTPAVGGVCK